MRCHDGGVIQERGEDRDLRHNAHQGAPLATGAPQHVPADAIERAGFAQTGGDHEQRRDRQHSGVRETD